MKQSAYDITLASNRKARLKPVVTTFLLVLAGLPFIFAVILNGIPDYDDEGTLMIAFRQLINGDTLYHSNYALYGPFYYFIMEPFLLWSEFH